jgi:hypothetical protein
VERSEREVGWIMPSEDRRMISSSEAILVGELCARARKEGMRGREGPAAPAALVAGESWATGARMVVPGIGRGLGVMSTRVVGFPAGVDSGWVVSAVWRGDRGLRSGPELAALRPWTYSDISKLLPLQIKAGSSPFQAVPLL